MPLLPLLVLLAAAPAADPEPSPREVFERRILPILRSPDPSSCVQCHLAGVDLKNYIRPSPEETFVSLRDQGLIDLERPENSRILALIRMGGDDASAGVRVHQKARRAEVDAFADWITRAARDPRLRGLPRADAARLAAPPRPPEVIRHARLDRVLATFTDTVWALRFRCMGCHTEGSAECQKLVAKHGPRVAWFKAEGPAATLAALRGGRLIDVEHPERSLLLRKPLAEVEHGGGKKFAPGDQGYRAFRTFLEDYARLVKDGYPDAASLPGDLPGTASARGPHRFGTDTWLKLKDTPSDWGDRLLQVTLYAWDKDKGTWEAEPIATSDRVVWGGGRLWQHSLTLLAAPGSARAAAWEKGRPRLPPGRYRVRIHVDRDGRLAKDWQARLGDESLAGELTVESAWPEGYGKMTVADAARVTRP